MVRRKPIKEQMVLIHEILDIRKRMNDKFRNIYYGEQIPVKQEQDNLEKNLVVKDGKLYWKRA